MDAGNVSLLLGDVWWNDTTENEISLNGTGAVTTTVHETTNAETLLAAARIGMVPVSVLGLLGNMLTLLVVRRNEELRKNPVSVYLPALAIGDLIFCVDLLRWYFEWAGLIPAEWGDVYCKIMNFLGHFSTGLTHWMIFCIALERMVRVAFPYQAKFLLTLKLARTVVVVFVFVVGLVNSPRFVFEYLIPLDNTTWMCWTLPTDTFGPLYYNLMRILIETPPVFLVILLNCITVVKLRSHWTKMKKGGVIKDQSGQNRGGVAQMSSQEIALTVTLVINGTLFVMLETPYLVTEFVAHYNPTETIPALLYTLANAFKLVSGVDHTCNFFVYITGSPMLRREFFSIFRRPKSPSRDNGEMAGHVNPIPIIVQPDSSPGGVFTVSSASIASVDTQQLKNESKSMETVLSDTGDTGS